MSLKKGGLVGELKELIIIFWYLNAEMVRGKGRKYKKRKQSRRKLKRKT